jgi:four helix bundle protein
MVLKRKKIMGLPDLNQRTLDFTVEIMKLTEKLPDTNEFRVISNQILRSSSSVGANYRAAKRAKSLKDFSNKLKIVEEEADETIYWLEVLQKRSGPGDQILKMMKEGNELLAIFVASIKTARANLALQKNK